MLFFDKAVDRQILGLEFPSSALLSLGPLFVLICSPLLVLFSERVLEKGKPLNGLIKIGIGFILTSLSFGILAFSCHVHSDLISPVWVVGSILIQTLGELLIVPIGFSNISKLAPPRLRSLMMSFWLMAIAYGHYFGGMIAQGSVNPSPLQETALMHYHAFFLNLALMPCLVGIGLFCTRILTLFCAPIFKKQYNS